MLDGREWNVRLSGSASPALFDKIRATFDTYWASADFERYDPDRDGDRLDLALGRSDGADERMQLSGLTLTAWPYQDEILEALDSERRNHNSWRNLVVAPTGTGKTVVAALDYRRLRSELGGEPSLLFVAHRERILSQARRTFREALVERRAGRWWLDALVSTDVRARAAPLSNLVPSVTSRTWGAVETGCLLCICVE